LADGTLTERSADVAGTWTFCSVNVPSAFCRREVAMLPTFLLTEHFRNIGPEKIAGHRRGCLVEWRAFVTEKFYEEIIFVVAGFFGRRRRVGVDAAAVALRVPGESARN
jgi:hypothetical protein